MLVCDDMGTEIADFIALDETNRRVIATNAKAFSKAKPLSAGALHEMTYASASVESGCLNPHARDPAGAGMPRGYPPELRRKVLDLLALGKIVAEFADGLGVSGQTIYNWRNQDLEAQVGVGVVGTQPDADNTTVLEFPKELSGHVTLLVGREAAPGAFNVFEYDRINELAPTGAFYCLGLDPRDPAALGQALVQRGFRAMWNYENLAHNVGHEVAAPPEGTVATWAWFRGPKLVDIRIVDDGPEAQAYREAEGTFVPGETPPGPRPAPDRGDERRLSAGPRPRPLLPRHPWKGS